MVNFYCQQKCGDENFSINEWNKAFQYCIDNNLSETEMEKILDGEPCKKQCFDCMAIVGGRQQKTKIINMEDRRKQIITTKILESTKSF